jgi:hypothetical protein
MSGKRWHVPSASATPWDGIEDSDLTPSQIVVRDSHRSVYEFRHRALSEAGDAAFLNGYERDRCPRCESVHVLRWGHEASGVRRYMCGGCRKTFTPSTGTIFEDHKLPVADWVEFMVQAFGFESLEAMTREDRRSGTTTPWWMAKLFLVLRGVQDEVVLSGEVQIDEKAHPLAAKDRPGGNASMGAYSKDKICIAVGCDDSGRSIMVRAGLGKPGKSRCWDAYGGHIEPGSKLVHDRENAHSVLVERLGLESVSYRSADLRGLDDAHNPLARVNRMHFLLKEFMHRHSGFDRDRIDDWLNLFSVIVNPPEDRLEKAAMVLDRAMATPISLPYRGFYGQTSSSE